MSASVSLPIVTGGVGASVPTTTLGPLKTLIATGVDGIVEVEASIDGINFVTVASLSLGAGEQILSLVCAAMRVNAANGSANSISVMAEEAICKFGVVPSPPTNGPGASLNVSDFGFLTSVIVTQPSGGGTVEIQISEDDVNWTTAYQSAAFAKLLDAPTLSGNFIRAVGNQATAASIAVASAISEGNDAALFAPKFPAPFTTPPEFVTIYARLTGSDANGDGSLANPYRTFQRAIQDVPLSIPTGVFYRVDITGIGVEQLPVDYTMPRFSAESIGGAGIFPLSLYFGEFPLAVQADPMLATMSNAAVPVPIPPAEASVNLADFTLSIDQVTGRPTLTLNVGTRPSWANDGMKGKIFRTLADPNLNLSTLIARSTDTSITLVGSPALMFGLGGPFEIQDCSATLQSDAASVYGLDFTQDTYFVFSGIRLSNADPNGTCLSCSDEGLVFFFFCELGILGADAPELFYMLSTYWHDATIFTAVGADILQIEDSLLSNVFMIPTGQLAVFAVYRSTIRDCGPFEPHVLHFDPDSISAVNSLLLDRVNVEDSTGDFFIFHGAAGKIRNTRIDDCAGNGFLFQKGAGCVIFDNVAGSGNAGFGVVVDSNGAQIVADPLTTLTGALGDASVGGIGATPWSAITGSGDALSGPVGPTMTLTDAAGLFTAGMVGKILHLSGFEDPNNGAFLITAFIDAQNIEYTNAGGVAETFLGNWAVLDPAGPSPYNVTDFAGPTATGSRLVQTP